MKPKVAEPVSHLHSWCISADPAGNINAKAMTLVHTNGVGYTGVTA